MPIDSPAHRLIPHLRRMAQVREGGLTDAELLTDYVANRDQAAFALLVKRHGPMVLGVCRRVVGHSHSAEDAFQAVFLVLARRAAAVRPREMLGHWLYGVAYRTALKARGISARLRAKETQVADMPHPHVLPEEIWSDLLPILDEELARLSEKHRLPIVLCDLEGRTQREVARELKCPVATLTSRLAAARRLLARRLTERGIVLSGGALASVLGSQVAQSAVPVSLAALAVKSAVAVSVDGSMAGIPAHIAQLSDGVMKMFVLSKLKTATVGALSGLVLLAGLGLFAGQGLRAGPEESKPPLTEDKPAVKAAKNDSDDLIFLRRTSLDLRGVMPTSLENSYFIGDNDIKKRDKIVGWMTQDSIAMKRNCQACHQPVPDPKWKANFTDEAHRHTELGVEIRPTDSPSKGKRLLFASKEVSEDEKRLAELTTKVETAKAELTRLQKRLDDIQERIVPGGLPQVVQQEKNGILEAIKTFEKLSLDRANFEATMRQASKKQSDSQKAVERGLRWLAETRKQPGQTFYDFDLDGHLDILFLGETLTSTSADDTEFLRRAFRDICGSVPTFVERQYFIADADPKKRGKLVEQLLAIGNQSKPRDQILEAWLKDAQNRKSMTAWYEKKLSEEAKATAKALETQKAAAPVPDRLEQLLGELFARKLNNEQVLDALCLATIAHLPTETEKKLILEGLSQQQNREAAWKGVLRSLASTREASQHAANLARRGAKGE